MSLPITLPLPSDEGAPTWRDDAACREADVELFFAHGEESQREALAMCEACPVRDACLEHALTAREPYGIWGGTGEQERKRMIRRRRSAAA